MAWQYLKTNHKITAGLWLCILFLKPQYILLPVLFFLYRKEFKILATMFLGGGGLACLSLLLVGSSGIEKYGQFLTEIIYWKNIYTVNPLYMDTWRGFLQLIFQKTDIDPIFMYWIAGVV